MSRIVVLLLGLTLFSPLHLVAQSGESGTGELALSGGGTFGIGSHPFAGGSSGIAFSRWAVAMLDFGYNHLGNQTLIDQPANTTRDSNLYDFGFTLHLRYPVNEKWAPYAIIGPGMLWNHYVRAPGNSATYVPRDDVRYATHTGAGLRYHISEKWGVRPEVKITVGSRTYTTVSVGVFFNVPAL